MKKYALLIIAWMISTYTVGYTETPEAIAKRFSTALNELNPSVFVEEFHPEMHEFFHGFALHLVRTTDDAEEAQVVLEELGFESFEKLEKENAKLVTLRFFEMSFRHVTESFRKASRAAETSIIGTLTDGEIIYVVYMTNVAVQDISTTVPSVMLLKDFEGDLKVMNTTQMETVRGRAAAQGYIP